MEHFCDVTAADEIFSSYSSAPSSPEQCIEIFKELAAADTDDILTEYQTCAFIIISFKHGKGPSRQVKLPPPFRAVIYIEILTVISQVQPSAVGSLVPVESIARDKKFFLPNRGFQSPMGLRQDVHKGTYFALTRSRGTEPDVPLKGLPNLNEFVTMCVQTCEDKTYCEHPFSQCISCYLRRRLFRRLTEHWRLSTQAEQRGDLEPSPFPTPHAHISKTLINYPESPFHWIMHRHQLHFASIRQNIFTFLGAWASRCPDTSQLIL